MRNPVTRLWQPLIAALTLGALPVTTQGWPRRQRADAADRARRRRHAAR